MACNKQKAVHVICCLCLVIIVILYLNGQVVRRFVAVDGLQLVRGSVPNSTQSIIPKSESIRYIETTTLSRELDWEVRVQRLQRVCKGREKDYKGRGNLSFNVHVDDIHNIVFCQIQKSGSTFWKQVIEYTMRKDIMHYKSPFGITYSRMNIPHLGFPQFKGRMPQILRDSFKFLFVREPYGRLFAGYVDKFFSPNDFYWNLLGKYIESNTREYSKRTVCAHDVTFNEFIKYVIQSEKDGLKRDRHFTPQYGHCQPCHINYDFIGKMENFKKDAMFVLDIINKKSNNTISFGEHFKTDSEVESIKEKIRYWFFTMNDIEKCTYRYELLLRMWRNFQIRGILSKHADIPVSRYDAHKVTRMKFQKMALAAYEKYKHDKSRHRNKIEALIEAYSQIDKKDMQQLKDVVNPDCQLFGYDPEPKYLFQIDRGNLPTFQYLNIGN